MAWGTPKTWAFEETPTAANMNAEIRDRMNKLFGGASGDSEADVPHKHLAGTLANRPAPGNAGRIYIPTDLPLMLVDDGTDWQIGGPLVTGTDWFHDDLTAGYAENWDTSASGGGTVTDGSDSTSRARLSTVGGGSGFALLRTKNVAHMNPASVFLCYMRIISLDAASTSQQIQCGLSSGFPASVGNPVDGLYIRKTNTGNFFGISCSASTEQETADLGTTASSYTDFIIEGNGGTTVYFYVNGLKAQAAATGSVSTSLPTNSLLFSFKIIESSAANRRIDVDAGSLAVAR